MRKPEMIRLAFPLPLALAVALAAGSAGAAECRVNHNNSCADSGAHCGAKQTAGTCETLYRRTWRHTEISCTCRPTHPPHHGGFAVP
jgi:hypothetical protein